VKESTDWFLGRATALHTRTRSIRDREGEHSQLLTLTVMRGKKYTRQSLMNVGNLRILVSMLFPTHRLSYHRVHHSFTYKYICHTRTSGGIPWFVREKSKNAPTPHSIAERVKYQFPTETRPDSILNLQVFSVPSEKSSGIVRCIRSDGVFELFFVVNGNTK
jgi:hypothetical protein